MKYEIETIEGIGPTYGEKLKAVGITDTEILLQRCGSRSGRADIAKETGLSEALVLKWTNMDDRRASGGGFG